MSDQPVTSVSTTREVTVSYENEWGSPITLDELSRFVSAAYAAGFDGDTKVLRSSGEAFLTWLAVKKTEKS